MRPQPRSEEAFLDIAGQGPFPLRGNDLTIGRSPSCDLIVDTPEVSRLHARILTEAGRHAIVDLKSGCGTFVNDRRISALTELTDQDRIRIGQHRLTYHHGARARAGSTVSVIQSTRDVTEPETQVFGAGSESKLRALLEITRSLQEAESLEALLPTILERVFQIYPSAHRGYVFLLDDREELQPVASRSREGEMVGPPEVSQTVIDRAVGDRAAILSMDTQVDENLQGAQSVAFHEIRSVLCAPLLRRNRTPLGVLHLHSRHEGEAFTGDDLDLLVSVASATALAVENAQLQEARLEQERLRRDAILAREVQQRFLPSACPERAGYQFFQHYEPAREVGGDYYTFLSLSGERLAVAMGDISGKGVRAALLMARLSSDVRHAFSTTDDPAEALGTLHRQLLETELDDCFVTLVLMVLDFESHTALLANAGHLDPLVRLAAGGVEPIGREQAGLPLNVSLDPAYRYRTTRVPLDPGCCILLCTDGVTEARNEDGQEFGPQRLADGLTGSLARGRGEAPQVGAEILSALHRFASNDASHDDVALICISRNDVAE